MRRELRHPEVPVHGVGDWYEAWMPLSHMDTRSLGPPGPGHPGRTFSGRTSAFLTWLATHGRLPFPVEFTLF